MSDFLRRLVVEAYDGSESKRMVAALALSRIDTHYGENELSLVADDIGKRVRTVYRWVLAGNTWRFLRKHCRQRQKVGDKWIWIPGKPLPRVSMTHYTTMGELLKKYEPDPIDAIAVLRTAHEEKTTVDGMKRHAADMWRNTIALLQGVIDGALLSTNEVIGDVEMWPQIPARTKGQILTTRKILENE